MTISELKEKSITELTKIAKTLDIPGVSGLRKQDLIFKILQVGSCARRITTTCRDRTTFMFRRRRFASLI